MSSIPLDGYQDSLSAVRALLTDRDWRQLCWYTPYVTPALYDSPEVIDALRQRVVTQPRVQCQLLLPAATVWQRDCPRLVALVERLSALELRALAPEQSRERPEFKQAFLIADGEALLHWSDPRRCLGRYSEHGSARGRELTAFFVEIWQKSQPETDVRDLRL